MTPEVNAYHAKATEYDRKAETMGKRNAPIREYYQRLAQHWRSLAALAQRELSASNPAARLGANNQKR